MSEEAEYMLERLRKFCASEDRCTFQIRQKLHKSSLKSEERQDIIEILKDENFLDEQRYAASFVRGKFRIKKWGKLKLQQALYKKFIPQEYIDYALDQIDADEYITTIQALVDKKIHDYDRNGLIRHLASKGFELELLHVIVDKQYGNK